MKYQRYKYFYAHKKEWLEYYADIFLKITISKNTQWWETFLLKELLIYGMILI